MQTNPTTKCTLQLEGASTLVTFATTGSDIFAYKMPKQANFIELMQAGTNGIGKGTAPASGKTIAAGDMSLGAYGHLHGTPAGTFPAGAWVKVRFSFDIAGIVMSGGTWKNHGRADYTIVSNDNETVYASGRLPKVEFPIDNTVWKGIETCDDNGDGSYATNTLNISVYGIVIGKLNLVELLLIQLTKTRVILILLH